MICFETSEIYFDYLIFYDYVLSYVAGIRHDSNK